MSLGLTPAKRRSRPSLLLGLQIAAGLALLANIGLRITCIAASEKAPATRQLEEDSHEYLELAESLVTRGSYGRFWDIQPADRPQYVPELCRTPAYPVLLAALGSTRREGWLAPILVQHLVGFGVIALGGLLAPHPLRRSAPGLLVVLLLATDLQAVAYSNRLLTEFWYGFFLLCGVAPLAWVATRGSLWAAGLAGVLLGASSLVRPTSFALPVTVAATLAVMAFREPGKTRRGLIAAALLLALVGEAVPIAWATRNHFVCGETRLSSIDRYNALFEHASGALARAEGIPVEDARERVSRVVGLSDFQIRHLPLSGDENDRIRAEVVRTISAHPKGFAIDWLLNTVNTFFGPDKGILVVLGFPPPHLGILQPRGGSASVNPIVWVLLALNLAHLAIVYGLAANSLRLVALGKRVSPLVPICLVVALYVLVLQSGRPGDPRMRAPVVALLVVAGTLAAANRPQD